MKKSSQNTKGEIKVVILRIDLTIGKRIWTTTIKQTIVSKTLQRNLKIKQYKPHFKLEGNSCALEWYAVPVPVVAPVM
jgi:hypothetical protein